MAIYWNNHHHLFHAVRVVDGRVLWANMLLLFCLSLVPFGTAWMGEDLTQSVPVAALRRDPDLPPLCPTPSWSGR